MAADQRQGDHFHFVDAAGGGYAAAAESLERPQPTAAGGEQRSGTGNVWDARGPDEDEDEDDG